MADTSLGFRFRGRLNGGDPTYREIVVADAAFARGDMVNLESGQVDLLAAADTAAVGMVNETKSGMTTGTDTIEVIVDADAIYGVYDANARLEGATLDISGTTGAQTVGASSQKNFVVVATSAADEETLVRWNVGKHVGNVAL